MAKLNLEILSYEETPLGVLCLRRRELLSQPGTIVTEVTLNHEFLMSSLYTDSERALSNIAIEKHNGSELKVLVGGLGLGYTTFEALKSDRVASVEVVDFLPQVIGWTRDGLIPLADQLNSDDRLKITLGDVYERVTSEPVEIESPSADSRFDLILIDVDHSPEDRLGDDDTGFYSAAGLKKAAKHLSDGGILGVWSYAESSPFADALRDVFENVDVRAITHQNELIDQEHTDWLFFASKLR